MRTVVLGPAPAELQSFIERRRTLGIDTFDEVWEGSYHVAPAASAAHGYLDNLLAVLLDPYARSAGLVGTGPFNLGGPQDYRVPDRGYHRGVPHGTWLATAAVVVEIISPDDETYEKFGFFARHAVDEILTADPASCATRAPWPSPAEPGPGTTASPASGAGRRTRSGPPPAADGSWAPRTRTGMANTCTCPPDELVGRRMPTTSVAQQRVDGPAHRPPGTPRTGDHPRPPSWGTAHPC